MGRRKRQLQERQARRRSLHRRTLLMVIAAIALLVFAVTRDSRTGLERRTAELMKQPWARHFATLIFQWHNAHPPDKWLLQTRDQANDPTVREKIRTQLLASLQGGLSQNSKLPKVAQIQKRYREFLIIYSAGNQFDWHPPETMGNTGLQVLVYPKEFFGQWPSLVQFDVTNNRLVLAAITYPDQRWLTNFVAHELWHGIQWEVSPLPPEEQKQVTNKGVVISDTAVAREVEAHELGEAVMNHQTDGKWQQIVSQILSTKQAQQVEDLLGLVQFTELKQLDGLFAPGGQIEEDLRFTAYCWSIFNTWLKTKYQGEELLRRQKDLYRLLLI